MIEKGQRFPEFTLPDENGNPVSLGDLVGHKAVIYFYPKDDTSGCTTEACEFRDAIPAITGARIIGVSPDSPKSHRKFIDKYGLTFTLLADQEHDLSNAVGVWVEKSMYGKTYMGIERSTFIIDESGVVEKIYRKVKAQGHAGTVLGDLARA
jgi:peroxiredoxin Q/BCP